MIAVIIPEVDLTLDCAVTTTPRRAFGLSVFSYQMDDLWFGCFLFSCKQVCLLKTEMMSGGLGIACFCLTSQDFSLVTSLALIFGVSLSAQLAAHNNHMKLHMTD